MKKLSPLLKQLPSTQNLYFLARQNKHKPGCNSSIPLCLGFPSSAKSSSWIWS